MNKLWMRHFKAVVWKEFIEGWRKTRLFIPLTVIFVVIMQYIPVAQIVNNKQLLSVQKEELLGVLTMYFALMTIPFLGTTIFSRSLFEEKKNGSIQTLLASGIFPTAIWSGKFIVAIIFSYSTTILTMLMYWLFIKFYVGENLILSGQTVVLTFLTMPIAAIGMLALIGWAYWALKNPQLIGLIVPILSTVGIINFVINYGQKYPLPIIVLLSLIIGVILISISLFGISRLSKERISDF